MKDKLRSFVRENRFVLLTGVLSILVVSIIYTLQKIAPFGNNSMLDIDFYHQYGPLLNELYDRVKSGETLLYSFNTGGGIPFYRNFLNYLSSPFNLILFVFKKENIVMAFSLIIGFKAVFASVTMSFYLKRTFKKNNVLICLFGLLYAFSGYFCAYYWNIMWLDGMVFLPLIALGINRLVDDENPCLYVVSLAVMLFANYFIGYMICIFAVLYFLGYFWYRRNFKLKNVFKKFLTFGISSLLAAGLVAFALVPLFQSLSSISATKDVFPSYAINFNVLDYLFNHLTGVSRTVFASDPLPLPNVYAGMLTFGAIFLFFLNKHINWRAKVLAVAGLLVFLISFEITTLDYVMHAFHVPNDLPYRYSFIYVFLIVIIGYYGVLRIRDLGKFKVMAAFMITTLIVLLSFKLDFANITDKKVITCLALVVCYYLIYLIAGIKNVSPRLIACFITALVVGECVYGINSNWDIEHDITVFMGNKKPYTKLIEKARKDDNGLYRMEKTGHLTLNDGAWYDYYGISTFTSMAYEDVSKFQRMIGMAGNNINSYYYQNYQTPVYNTMFNVKYVMGNYVENDYYVPIDSADTYNLVGYNYSSSLVYMVNRGVKNWRLVSYMPFYNQANFVSLATGEVGVFNDLKVTNVSGGNVLSNDFLLNSNGEFSYELGPGSKSMTFFINNEKETNVYLYVGGANVRDFSVNNTYYPVTSDEYYVVDAGKFPGGDVSVTINFDSADASTIKFYAYTLNDEKFKRFYEKISDGELKVTKYSETYIEGKIRANKDQIAFSTISYDDGWRVYVDGKKTKTYKLANAYLGFDVPPGEHEVKLIYYPKGMKTGILISTISFIILMLYLFFDGKQMIKNNKKDEFNV